MPQTGSERQSVGKIAVCGLVFICTAIPVGLLFRVGWQDWPLFADVWAALYVMGRNAMVSLGHTSSKGLLIRRVCRHGAAGS